MVGKASYDVLGRIERQGVSLRGRLVRFPHIMHGVLFFSRAVRPKTFIYQGPEIWCNRNPGTLIANCDRKSLHDTNENEMHAVLGYPTVGLRVRVTCVSISVHILVLTGNGLTSISPSSPLNMIDGVEQLLP